MEVKDFWRQKIYFTLKEMQMKINDLLEIFEKVQTQEEKQEARQASQNFRAGCQNLEFGGKTSTYLVKKPLPAKKQKSYCIEGVFDGQKMIGQDGQEYEVSANYASKSKLVEGDLLKLIINEDGSSYFKQIGPVARAFLRGKISRNENNQYVVQCEGQSWLILEAAIKYFQAKEGDEAVIIVPAGLPSKWAALDFVDKKE